MNCNISPLFPECAGTAYDPAAVFFSGLLFLSIVLFLSFLISRYAANRWGGNRKKTLFAFVGISTLTALALLCFFGLSAGSIRGIIFCHLLLLCAYSDLQTRECDDWLSVMILLAGFIGTETKMIPARVGAMLFVAAVMLIPSLFSKDGIGGADIKISAASAFLLGLRRGLLGLTVGLLAAVVINAVRQKDKKAGFPMIPYLAVPMMAVYFL
ncbi:MAG: prepilin peptidase [Clostridia bacterium]|nr:prepilin peptidase [Clostridia bacterium]